MRLATSTRHLTAQKEDPTQTKTIRETYASRIRGRFGALSAAIREGVISDDVLGLRTGAPTTDADRLTDTFAELEAIDAPPDLSTLSEAEQIARRLTDRVDKIGKTRATAFARTESINAHTTATLQRYEQLGVEEVGVEPEVRIETAGDAAVCEQCQDAAGRGPWPIDEFRQSPYRPPLHVNCRCTVLPVVSG